MLVSCDGLADGFGADTFPRSRWYNSRADVLVAGKVRIWSTAIIAMISKDLFYAERIHSFCRRIHSAAAAATSAAGIYQHRREPAPDLRRAHRPDTEAPGHIAKLTVSVTPILRSGSSRRNNVAFSV
jgi:hypothetical protein